MATMNKVYTHWPCEFCKRGQGKRHRNGCTFWDAKQARILSVYEITRHYGGPEEGGWYYNWNQLVATVRVRGGVTALERAWNRLYDKHVRGNQPKFDIYSAANNGEGRFEIFAESYVGEHQTRYRPRYE
jgi:hypothetical protein